MFLSQLVSEFSTGRLFEGFQEGPVTFSPTYKYQPNSDQYYWCFEAARGEKKRAPAWLASLMPQNAIDEMGLSQGQINVTLVV